MNISRTVKSILELLDKYKDFLSGLSEEEFQRSPAEGGWSHSEVYSHVLQVNRSSGIAIERCAFGNKNTSGRLSLAAWIVLFFGKFPGRLKAPDQIAATVKKIELEEAKNDIFKSQEKFRELLSVVQEAPNRHKIKHPILGMLNAKQWLRFIEIHTRHHLKQLKRIELSLNHTHKFNH